MSDGTIGEQTYSLYRVHYKDHEGGTWSVVVQTTSEQKAEELVNKEADCKRVECVDQNYL